MPLPAALQARLKQRGLIKNSNLTEQVKHKNEEVFAESYDKPKETIKSNVSEGSDTENDNSIGVTRIPNCPNRSNPYHECTAYCKKRYGVKKFEPSSIMEKRRLRMLKAYPLPADWVEVPDLNTNRYYYWNLITDQITWLSPSHPKAKIEFAKIEINETKISNTSGAEKEDENEVNDDEDQDDDDENTYDSDDDDEVEEEQEETENNQEPEAEEEEEEEEENEDDEEDIDELLTSYEKNETKPSNTFKNTKPTISSNTNRNHNKKNYNNNKRGTILNDPMDPSSYSDCPKGKWSAGLEQE